MAAAAKAKKQDKARHLTIAPQRDTYQDPDIPVDPRVHANLTLDVTEADIRATLDVGIENREWALANGEPIPALLRIPDYGSTTPGAMISDPISVDLDKLEALGQALVRLGQEAKRYGILPQEG